MCYIFNFSFSIFPHLYIFRFQPNHITSKPHGMSVRFLYSARRGELALLSLTLYKNAGSAPQNRVCCVMMTARGGRENGAKRRNPYHPGICERSKQIPSTPDKLPYIQLTDTKNT